MRIGLLTDVYRPGFSGVANHVMLLKEGLKQHGQQAFVFAFERGQVAPGDPDVIYSPGVVLAADYPFGLRLSARASALLRTMDILHIHQPFASGSAALHAARQCRLPMLFTAHTRYDLYTKAYLPFLPYRFSTFAIRAYMRVFSRRMALIIAPSTSMADLLRTWRVQAPVQIIPNGINLQAFFPDAGSRAALRRQLGLPEAACIYIFVGRIADEKNIDFLLSSFEMVCQHQPQTALVLVGTGPKFRQVQAAVQSAGFNKKVIMTGRVPYEMVPDYMRAADVFVTASKTEVHPLTIIEAGASSLPVVGLRAPGVTETVLDGETGFLCADNPPAFAEHMRTLALKPDVRLTMGNHARRVSLTYSAESTTEQVLEQYQAVFARNQQ